MHLKNEKMETHQGQMGVALLELLKAIQFEQEEQLLHQILAQVEQEELLQTQRKTLEQSSVEMEGNIQQKNERMEIRQGQMGETRAVL